MVGVMATFSKRTYASMLYHPALLQSAPLTPRQATVNPFLHQRLSNTHRQVWLRLLWGHCPFSQVLLCTRICLCPPSCLSPVEVLKSNPTGLQHQSPQVFSVPLLDPQLGKPVVVQFRNLFFSLSSCFLVSFLFYPFYPFVKSLRK